MVKTLNQIAGAIGYFAGLYFGWNEEYLMGAFLLTMGCWHMAVCILISIESLE